MGHEGSEIHLGVPTCERIEVQQPDAIAISQQLSTVEVAVQPRAILLVQRFGDRTQSDHQCTQAIMRGLTPDPRRTHPATGNLKIITYGMHAR